MFGPAFLVNPVTEYRARSRPVYLPAGTWYDFWTGKRFTGGTTVTADAPVETMPLFVRAGSIVPVGPDQQYIGEKSRDELTLYVLRRPQRRVLSVRGRWTDLRIRARRVLAHQAGLERCVANVDHRTARRDLPRDAGVAAVHRGACDAGESCGLCGNAGRTTYRSILRASRPGRFLIAELTGVAAPPSMVCVMRFTSLAAAAAGLTAIFICVAGPSAGAQGQTVSTLASRIDPLRRQAAGRRDDRHRQRAGRPDVDGPVPRLHQPVRRRRADRDDIHVDEETSAARRAPDARVARTSRSGRH